MLLAILGAETYFFFNPYKSVSVNYINTILDNLESIFKKYFYLFIFRDGGGRAKERERNVNVWLPGLHPGQVS